MSFKYSANVGFLWADLPLPERIEAAAKAGFDAVECHFPYEHKVSEIDDVLKSTGLPMLGLDQAINYAVAINAKNINVVAGVTDGGAKAQSVYVSNLQYACDQAADHGKTIMIEPLNPRAVANYHFSTVEQAVKIIEAVERDNMKLMFDFFHAQIVEGDLETVISAYVDHFTHVQISAVHDRGEPDEGEINYRYVLGALKKAGYKGYIGAEYKPRGDSVESGLSWLSEFRSF